MAKSRVMPEHAHQKPGTPGTEPPEPAMAPERETAAQAQPKEIGGREGPEPVRYGDWEKNGRCIDF